MISMGTWMMACVHHLVLLSGLMVAFHTTVEAVHVLTGVCHSTAADNLPDAIYVNNVYRKYNIGRAMFYNIDGHTLEQFIATQVDISVAISDGLLPEMATSQELVDQWFDRNIKPFLEVALTGFSNVNYIVVGNKAFPILYDVILPVMKLLRNTLFKNNATQIKITTLMGYRSQLEASYPPSDAQFKLYFRPFAKEILQFLRSIGSPLMVSIYPYLEFKNEQNISLNYANFRSTEVMMHDGKLKYYNLFDAMVDAFYRAMSKLGIDNVDVVVGETGWPTCGDGRYTTPKYAGMYNRRFVKHIESGKGTPLYPNIFIEGFIQSMFNENLKPEGIDRCFGIFNLDMTPAYHLFVKKFPG